MKVLAHVNASMDCKIVGSRKVWESGREGLSVVRSFRQSMTCERVSN
jgi:hypothetical protein